MKEREGLKILYVPIDERPCNTHIVNRIADTVEEIELFMPPIELFGLKKIPANSEKIWEWIYKEAAQSEALILSIDMLIYGGLLPSRIHHIVESEAVRWIERLKLLHKDFPNLPIYASNLIMRTPKYSSSDEEPDYYEKWGREIFLQAYLKDKGQEIPLTSKEKEQLDNIQNNLPRIFLKDYENRRKFNLQINKQVLHLVKEGVITFLVIPQDDSAEYGYTARDQKIISFTREQLNVYKQVFIYPGADEVGATLLARVYNDFKGYRPKIYPIWSSTLGPSLIPLYEDRPFFESMKSHIYAAGCQLVNDPNSADLILAYNVPGRIMQESWDQSTRDVSYSSFRNLNVFVDEMKYYIEQGKSIIVADSAYANGGDYQLIKLMDEEGILDKVLSYKGWNTNCNTLGTTISQGCLGLYSRRDKIVENIIYHLLDDYFYQSEIRMEMASNFLPKYGLNYFDLKDKAHIVNKERSYRLYNRFMSEFKNSFKNVAIQELNTSAPWNRMFECEIDLKVDFRLPNRY